MRFLLCNTICWIVQLLETKITESCCYFQFSWRFHLPLKKQTIFLIGLIACLWYLSVRLAVLVLGPSAFFLFISILFPVVIVLHCSSWFSYSRPLFVDSYLSAWRIIISYLSAWKFKISYFSAWKFTISYIYVWKFTISYSSAWKLKAFYLSARKFIIMEQLVGNKTLVLHEHATAHKASPWRSISKIFQVQDIFIEKPPSYMIPGTNSRAKS